MKKIINILMMLIMINLVAISCASDDGDNDEKECNGYGELVDGTCVCEDHYVLDEHDKTKCIHDDHHHDCPTCDNETEVLVGETCVKIEEVAICGPAGHAHGDHCHCSADATETTINGKEYCLQNSCVEPKDCDGHGELVDGTCVCEEGYVLDEHDKTSCIHDDHHHDCPTCDNETEVLVGEVCVKIEEVAVCGPAGHAHGDHYHCSNDATETTINGKDYCLQNSCVEPKVCSEHGKLVGDACVCDEGYILDSHDDTKCVLASNDCPACDNETEVLVGNKCVSITRIPFCGPAGHAHGDHCHCSSNATETTINGNSYCLQNNCTE